MQLLWQYANMVYSHKYYRATSPKFNSITTQRETVSVLNTPDITRSVLHFKICVGDTQDYVSLSFLN